MSSNADNTAQIQGIIPYQFKKESSGNPKGRPRGSRNKFSRRFFEDVHDVWEEGGLEILKAAAVKNPTAFVTAMAGLVPKGYGVEPPKTGVGFKAIWERFGSNTVPPMASPVDMDSAEESEVVSTDKDPSICG